MSDTLFLVFQRLLPKQLLTAWAGQLASRNMGKMTRWAIKRFVRRYKVDMRDAADSDIENYPSFNAFFTRALKPGARPISSAMWVCPADGKVSAFGRITNSAMIQAKGHQFTTRALLGSTALGAQFSNGHYATVYLSPRDYHRVHMPRSARLLRMVHIPGRLYSVNALTAQNISDLYARNERVVCLFEERDSEFGHGEGRRQFAMVLVGATIVGSIATEWHGVVTPPRDTGMREWDYSTQHIVFRKGAEMGRFLLGSTVIVLFPGDGSAFNPRWKPDQHVRVGEHMSHSIATQGPTHPRL